MPEYNAQTFGSYGAEWDHKGYCGSGNVSGLLDSLQGRTAIVAGNGRGVFEEVEVVDMGKEVIFAVNDVGVLLPRVDHFVSLHTPKLDLWVELRRDPSSTGYGNRDFRVHDAALYGERDWYQWKLLTPIMALSGMFAAQIAYLMGCESIILCGCPNDDTPRFWETGNISGNKSYVEVQRQIKQEMAFKPEFKKAVRSMSGWSKEFFGGFTNG